MDWSNIELLVFAKDETIARGTVFLPGDDEPHELTLTKRAGKFALGNDPFAGRVAWQIDEQTQ
jgi:alpha-D-xyloside xylohydrolase